MRANDSDFFFLSRRDPQSVLDTIVDLCRRRLPERMGIPADQIQVLSPTRRRGTGTRALNQVLQQALNPPREDKGERRFGDWVFRAGDKVMQVRNNYDILWREEGGTSSGMGMFNGDIAVSYTHLDVYKRQGLYLSGVLLGERPVRSRRGRPQR